MLLKGYGIMKKTVKFLYKCIIAGVVSTVLLSLLSLIYYNPPIATQQADLITNFKYKENSKWSFMLEGFGYGMTDELGYNNAYYKDCSQPDIIFMGSSHLEALQVPQDANCVYLLNEKFDKDTLSYNDFKCLNLGVSGHALEVSLSNFEYVIDKYKDAKYIVIETSNVEFSPTMLDEIAEGKFHDPEEKKGFIHKTAQKIPYIRLLYKKINEATLSNNVADENAGNGILQLNDDSDIGIYIDKMKVILNKIAKLSSENNIKPVVLIHQRFWEDSDGNIITANKEAYINAFKKCCENNGIKVIDVTKPMIDCYKTNFNFSYGFSNTAPGEGHLNKTGHRIIAEEVYQSINEMEENK